MVKVLYHNTETVDCTSDPHVVNYRVIEEMLHDVLAVCKSNLVQGIQGVTIHDKDYNMLYDSDYYSTYAGDDRKKAEGEFAKKHKVEGLYFAYDSDASEGNNIPFGLTGVKFVIDKILNEQYNIDKIGSIHIPVVWSFAGDSSCSDHIDVILSDMTVDYSNQDWWVDRDSPYEENDYLQHLDALGNLIGERIPSY